MKENLTRLGLASILVTAVIVMVTASLTLGDDDMDDPAGIVDSTTAMNTDAMKAAALDSVYVLINGNFQTIKPTVQGACFDCHSDNTDFPWYHSLPFIGSWMDGHVRDALDDLNMTNGFPFQTRMPAANSLAKIKREIEEGGMPIWSYRLMHSSARLSDEQKDSIYTWIDESLKLLETQGIKPMRRVRGGEQQDEEEH